MTPVEELHKQALTLGVRERALLAESLLSSLPALPEEWTEAEELSEARAGTVLKMVSGILLNPGAFTTRFKPRGIVRMITVPARQQLRSNSEHHSFRFFTTTNRNENFNQRDAGATPR